MGKIIVNLYDMVGTGIIIPSDTGVFYSNQTGGTNCLHPELEGFVIPILNDISVPVLQLISPENELEKLFGEGFWDGTGAVLGIREEDATAIEEIFEQYHSLKIEVDRANLSESHEAWIHIIIHEVDPLLVSGLDTPFNGILTWCNSD